jgi:hypothetical protein
MHIINKGNKENHSTLEKFDGVQKNNKKIWAKFTYLIMILEF